jgi:hypothetical protein
MKTTDAENVNQDAVDSNCLVDAAGMPIPIIADDLVVEDDQINEEQPSDDDPGDT